MLSLSLAGKASERGRLIEQLFALQETNISAIEGQFQKLTVDPRTYLRIIAPFQFFITAIGIDNHSRTLTQSGVNQRLQRAERHGRDHFSPEVI